MNSNNIILTFNSKISFLQLIKLFKRFSIIEIIIIKFNISELKS